MTFKYKFLGNYRLDFIHKKYESFVLVEDNSSRKTMVLLRVSKEL